MTSKLADPRTQLPPERWATLLALAAALGFRLPGPHWGRTQDQLRIFWQRAVRSSMVPSEEFWRGRDGFWLTWPRSAAFLGSGLRGPQHTARSTMKWTRGPDRDVARMEALVVLLHDTLAARAAAGEGPDPPAELVAEASRLLVSGRVVSEYHDVA